jgi:hypothetical protein
MEDASGVDLDWFWRAWFYDIEPVDVRLDTVIAYNVVAPQTVPVVMDTLRKGKMNSNIVTIPTSVKSNKSAPSVKTSGEYIHVSRLRNKAEGMKFAVDVDTTLRDFYFYYDEEKDTFGSWKSKMKNSADPSVPVVVNKYRNYEPVSPEVASKFVKQYYYELQLSNVGGAVTPVIIQWNFTDGSSEVDYINAYIWRKNEFKFTKNFMKTKEVASVLIDPFKETADINENDNFWPRGEIKPSRVELFKMKEQAEGKNPMQRAKK